ncbi:MAG: hypothetical protein CMB84_03135 [Flammeovirgaceae bacterium]|nr:hypothetical protein [Flammeovirgaceae bacterium]|tara:strand:- start:401 stop:895 length:495 start_codon:yes stop_codon:yes gene_type:complete
MSNKLFKNDKNYILKSVQNDTKDELLLHLLELSIKKYEFHSNPLGLVDSSFKKLKKYNNDVISKLNFFYRKISAIYRYNHGEVQLSFLWDGSSHTEFYRRRWVNFFKQEILNMTEKKVFLKTLLSLTILRDSDLNQLQYNLSTFIRKKFKIQVFKKKGVVLHTQ